MADFDKLLIATTNRGKITELKEILSGTGIRIVDPDTVTLRPVEETGTSFVENALLKARSAARDGGCAALGDDSGLEVDALNGEPGIYSARYAGPDASDRDNVRKLLNRLDGCPPGKRSARFRCALALVRDADDPEPLIAEGVWEGEIADEPRGNNGFGYDPVFVPEDSQRTAAELVSAEKNRISHRARALAALKARLAAGKS